MINHDGSSNAWFVTMAWRSTAMACHNDASCHTCLFAFLHAQINTRNPWLVGMCKHNSYVMLPCCTVQQVCAWNLLVS